MFKDCFVRVLAGCAMSMPCLSFASEVDMPDGLMVELLARPELTVVHDPMPEFSWINRSRLPEMQMACQIQVAGSLERLRQDDADVWDSGKVESTGSVAVPYAGPSLKPDTDYCWRVKTWNRQGGEGGWSEPQTFRTASDLQGYVSSGYPLQTSLIAPINIREKADNHYLIDFGRVAFGYLVLEIDSPVDDHVLTVHLAERGSETDVNKLPGGTVRYYRVEITLSKGRKRYKIHAPRDGRNTSGAAVKIPAEIGIVAPFRYVELEDCPVELKREMVQQAAIHYPFDEEAASFQSSSDVLNAVWDLCKYSMKATSFSGLYVDGDRERIPYEADAYINQLSHYAVDREYTLARRSHEYLLHHPTWPTEWKQHSVLMAWADYMYTGDTESIAHYYDTFKAHKTLENHAREDGLLNTRGLRDIVDWPQGERDSYDFKPVNTVVNAFYYKTLLQMADFAAALGKDDEHEAYLVKARKVYASFNAKLFDENRGVYIDGEGSGHAALHANMMPMAFGLVPAERVDSVARFIKSRGMACSVYGAQYLLEALYEANEPEAALRLMTSKDVRSWHNMLRVGSTITLEAWDNRFKGNQDWNHAWGAAPGNIISRYLLGVRPLEPGFARVLIKPMPGSLETASAKVPTIRGAIQVAFENVPGKPFRLDVEIPGNTKARVAVPLPVGSTGVVVNGRTIKARVEDGFAIFEDVGPGRHRYMSQAVVF